MTNVVFDSRTPSPKLERRTGAADRRRALPDFGNDLWGYVSKAHENREQMGADWALQALIGDVARLAKDLGITDAEGRHQ